MSSVKLGQNMNLIIVYRYIMFGSVFAKNTSRETKNFPSRMAREI